MKIHINIIYDIFLYESIVYKKMLSINIEYLIIIIIINRNIPNNLSQKKKWKDINNLREFHFILYINIYLSTWAQFLI